jgi:hypothetical protein
MSRFQKPVWKHYLLEALWLGNYIFQKTRIYRSFLFYRSESVDEVWNAIITLEDDSLHFDMKEMNSQYRMIGSKIRQLDNYSVVKYMFNDLNKIRNNSKVGF